MGVYALWCASLPIDSDVIDLAVERREVVPLTLLLASGALEGSSAARCLAGMFEQGDAYDRDSLWLFAYEAHVRGVSSNHRDPSFEVLASNDVRFVGNDGWVPFIC